MNTITELENSIIESEEYLGWFVLEVINQAYELGKDRGYEQGLYDGREEGYAETSQTQG